MARRGSQKESIVDAALELAEDAGWEGVRLHAVADRLGLGLAEVRAHFSDLDAVADAWLARADKAMLELRDDAAFAELEARERIYAVITRWLDALAGHRRVNGEIFRAKLYFGHPHHNVALVLWLSRTVQWLREAAHLDATGRRRQVEEIGLSALFVATIAHWLRDSSDNQERTRKRLSERLAGADRLMARLWPPPPIEEEVPRAAKAARKIKKKPVRPKPGRRPRAGSRA